MTNALRIIQLCLSCMALLGSTVAYTALAAHFARGEKIVELPAAGRSAEICVIPKHFPGALYSDKDLKAETQLCSIDEYTNTAVCPKTNSTNPGLTSTRCLRDSLYKKSRRLTAGCLVSRELRNTN